MVFNSLIFLAFFTVVFLIYWFPLKNTTKGQNIFLLLASYFFYGYADWCMLPLLIIATLIFYFLGKGIATAKSEKQSYWLTTLGVVLGVGTLMYFKYFNFFIESFAALFEACGLHTNLHTFNIIMPLGISFFTFRLLSYVIDIYRGKYEPTNDIVAFGTYVAFFPCLLSGPIDRPTFINQLKVSHTFEYDKAVDGCRQILWGLFKKVVVADNCSTYVNQIWGDIDGSTGSTLLLAAIIYAFQMYADFSGYSDMAIGVGKLLGFNITKNFNNPYFALNIADFWRRWHISLTSWLTDYVFMPLNIKLRDKGNRGIILAIVINFVLCGLWHGANWTFVLWGLYHGLLFVPLIISGAFYKKAKLNTNKFGLPIMKDFGKMILTFFLVVIGLILFRADSISQAWEYVYGIFDNSLFGIPILINRRYYVPLMLSILFMCWMEWYNHNLSHGLSYISRNGVIRCLVYLIIWFCVEYYFITSVESNSTFIYFQF